VHICLDAGHGGTDPGAVGTNPFLLEEKEVNLAVAQLLEGELEALGHWVVMSRRQDTSLSLAARAAFANRLDADFFVSIHANAAASEAARGFEVFHFPSSYYGTQASQAVLDSMASVFPGHRNRGVKEANFAVLRETVMPAILVETEFLTNPVQLQFLSEPANQHLLATAIAGGIDQYVREFGWYS